MGGLEKSQIDNSGREKSGLQSLTKKCDNCKTGPVTCQINQKCKIALLTSDGGNKAHPYIFLAESYSEDIFLAESYSVNSAEVTLVTGEKSCFRDMRALAIGGGGSADKRRGAGGGSGHLEFGLLQLGSNETLRLTGGHGSESSKIEKDGLEVLVAAAGQHGNGTNGGDGYSGGGAGSRNSNGGQDGGFDGSDGNSSGENAGGKGSGFDLATLNMTRFILTPGEAGTGIWGYGGGGGGILVNGKKPKGGRRRYDGEGFGGGRGYSDGYPGGRDGYPGCVLLEI